MGMKAFVRNVASAVGVSCLIGTVAVVAPTVSVVSAAPTTLGSINGTGYNGSPRSGVFRDINANGLWDDGEPGQGDIVVSTTCISEDGGTASSFDDQYVTASTTTSDSGAFTMAGPNVRGLCRVEFAIPANMQSFLQPGVATTAVAAPDSAGSFVQFVDATLDPTVTTAVMNPADYTNATNTPDLALSLQSTGSSNIGTNSQAGNRMVVTRFGYSGTGNAATNTPPTNTNLANFDDVGAVWGLAVQPSTATVFAATVVKRHAGVGPDGVDAIYALGSSVPAAWSSPFTAVDADGGIIPNDAGRGLGDFNDPSLDLTVFAQAGKKGWGDIDTSEDGTTLYAVNLHDKKIYAIDIATKTSSTSFTIPNPGCTNGNARPWGLAVHDGVIYAGVICDAATGSAANLAAFVYAYNPTSAGLPVAGLAADLAANTWSGNLIEEATPGAAGVQLDYTKGCALGADPCNWETWADTFSGNFTPTGNTWAASRPQPLLSDIAFDDDGSMILDFADRGGLQFGYKNDCANDGTADTACESVTGGDLLRVAVPSGVGSFTLENDGTVARGDALGGGTISGNTTNNQGPGGGEVYGQEYYDVPEYHQETSIGGLVKVPGQDEFVLTVMDPVDTDSNGTAHFPTDGSTRTLLAEWADSTGLAGQGFGKGSGLGDLEAISSLAPVEIGNRVWRDDNDNGLQDPGEPGIAGVDVTLTINSVSQTATTDSNGNYLFSSIARSGATTHTGLDPANYRLDAADDAAVLQIVNATGGSQQAALVGMLPTEANDATANETNNNGNNANDSDGVVNGSAVEVTFTLGALTGTNDSNSATGDSVDREGHNRHIFDFGFVPRVSLGNRVWFDTNNDSSMGGSEVGVSGVAVELFYDADNNGQIDGAEETPVAYDTTGASGLYFFDQFTDAAGNPLGTPEYLVPGNYVVGVALSNFTGTGVLVGYLSSAVTIANDGVINETTAPDPDNNTNADDNGTVAQSGFYAGGVMSQPVTVTYSEEPTTEDTSYNNDDDLVRDFASNLTVDFGFYRVSVGNVVWFDNGAGGGTADNGILDGTEPTTSEDVSVYLYSADGSTQIPVGADGVLNTADDGTDPVAFNSGEYLFSGLPGGSYTVVIELPTGYRSSNDPANGNTPLSTDSDDNGLTAGTGTVTSATFTLTPGDTGNGGTVNNVTGTSQNLRVDFGIIPSEYDLTISKAITSSGAYVAGSEVTFEIVAANNGPGLTTDGFSIVDRLPTGLSFDTVPATPGAYWICGSPTGQEITCTWEGPTVGYGNDTLGVDSTSAITIHAIVDTPAPDPIDDVINYTKVLPSPSMSEPETNLLGTDNDGFETGDPDTDSNNDDSALLNTTPVYSLGDLVWIDSDGDGFYDQGTELPIEGVTVELLDSFGIDPAVDAYGNTVPSTTTDADGRYSFEGLFAGDYIVRFTRPDGYVWTLTNDDPDDSLDSDGNYVGNDDTFAVISVELTGPVGPDNDLDGLTLTDPTNDVGLIPLVTVGDLVWIDTDMDGVYDVGSESGLDGVKVHLLDAAGDPATDAQGAPVAVYTTSSGGRYAFDNLLPGDYQVRFELPTGYIWTLLDQEADDSLDSDADWVAVDSPTATTETFALGGATIDNDPAGLDLTDPTRDAGVVPLLSVGDVVFIDANNNGVFDVATESTLDGVTVELLDTNGDPALDYLGNTVASTNTDGSGRYSFDNLLAGDYQVRFTLPTGYAWAITDAPGDDSLDSDGTYTLRTDTYAVIELFTLGAPTTDNDPDGLDLTDPTRDQGVVPIVSLGDLVFVDRDHDGDFDAGFDFAYQGATVDLLDGAGDPAVDADGNPVASATTDVNGRYSFSNLLPGDYQVQFTLPSGYVWTSTDAAPNHLDSDAVYTDVDDATATTAVFTLSATPISEVDGSGNDRAVTNPTIDAGITRPVDLGDFVWIDTDHDGLYDVGSEFPIEGVEVALLDAAGNPATDIFVDPVLSTTTDADGRYSFDNLFAGEYRVQFTLPSGYAWTTPNNVANGTLNSDAEYSSTVFDSTATTSARMVRDGVFTDDDPDGLSLDDPTFDAGVVPVLSLGDVVFLDTNMNGVFDSTEVGVENVTVELTDPSGNPVTDAAGNTVTSTTTDGDGRYSFDNLVPGEYQVRFTLPSGYVWTFTNTGPSDSFDNDALYLSNNQGTATTATVTLTSTVVPDDDANGLTLTNATIDAGIIPLVSVGDLVWIDTDRDGVFNNGEVGIDGVTVTLLDGNGDPATDAQGDPVPAATTDVDGRYDFGNLLPGDYEVVFTLPEGYVWTSADQGADDGLDSDAAAGSPTAATASTGVFTVLADVTDTDTGPGARLVTDPTRDAGVVVIVYDLALAKIGEVSGTGEDTVVDYTITVANQGTITSREFTVIDHVPAGLVVDELSISNDGIYDSIDNIITWTISDLADGETLDLTFSATVSDFTLRPYRNIAEIDSDSAASYGNDVDGNPVKDVDSTPDGSTGNDGDYGVIFDAGDIDNQVIGDAGVGADPEDDADIADVTVDLTYDLALAKAPSETTINPDGTVTFTITVENQGDVNSNDYVITDTLPAGTQATAASDGGVITPTTVTWDLTDLAPGDTRSVTVTVEITDITLRPFKNIAEISADGADDYDAVNGDYPGYDIEDVDSFPDAATDQDNGDRPDDGYGTFENPTNDIDDIADVDTIPNGEDDADVAFFDAPVLYDLALIKTGPEAIIGNGTATFTITIQNQGNVPSGDFTVVDEIPEGLIATAASDGGVIADPLVTWELTGLAPGATVSVTVTVQVLDFNSRGWLNFAEISSDGADDYDTEGYENASDGDVEDDDSVPNSDLDDDVLVDQTVLPTDQFNDPTVDEDDHDVAPITVDIDYDLALVKSLPTGQSFKAGQPIVFNITVKNQGNVDSGPITVQDVVPAGLGIVTASDGGLGVGQVVTWEISNLTPGQTKTLTITVTVINSTLASYINFAEIVADGADQYDIDGDDVEDDDSTPDTDITNDTLVDTDDVNIDQIPGDEDDHDRALLDPAKVKSDNPRGGTIPGTGSNSEPLLFGGAGLLGAGAIALVVARRRRKAAPAA